MINPTNILLLLIVAFLSYFAIQRIFNYFKNKYLNTGIQIGVNKIMTIIISKAKEGKSFNLKDGQDEVKLIILKKKNAKSISKQS